MLSGSLNALLFFERGECLLRFEVPPPIEERLDSPRGVLLRIDEERCDFATWEPTSPSTDLLVELIFYEGPPSRWNLTTSRWTRSCSSPSSFCNLSCVRRSVLRKRSTSASSLSRSFESNTEGMLYLLRCLALNLSMIAFLS